MRAVLVRLKRNRPVSTESLNKLINQEADFVRYIFEIAFRFDVTDINRNRVIEGVFGGTIGFSCFHAVLKNS